MTVVRGVAGAPASESPRAIRVVCPDMSVNALGRALVLAEIAARIAPTEVVGVLRGKELWAPARDFSVPLRCFSFAGAHRFFAAARWLRAQVAGAVVIVSKPRLTSLELTRAAGVSLSSVVLDIDDWELGLMMKQRGLPAVIPPEFAPPLRVSFQHLGRGVNAPFVMRAMEARALSVPTRLVSNGWLQRRFGGELLPHLRDTKALAPDGALRSEQRAALRLGDRVWATFVGTARAHKGLDTLVAAVAAGPDELGLMLCGLDEADAAGRAVISQARSALGEARVRVVPPFPASALPRVLSAADIAVVPSHETASSAGQIPAKLFDGLCMGLPVVASAVGNICDVVAQAGLTFPPGDAAALSVLLSQLVADGEQRRRLGERARQRAVTHYDLSSGVPTLRTAIAAAQSASKVGVAG